jgi:hypothetical protein
VESNSEKKVFAITGFTPVEDNDDEIDIVAVRYEFIFPAFPLSRFPAFPLSCFPAFPLSRK